MDQGQTKAGAQAPWCDTVIRPKARIPVVVIAIVEDVTFGPASSGYLIKGNNCYKSVQCRPFAPRPVHHGVIGGEVTPDQGQGK
jgi:hypothetical protein